MGDAMLVKKKPSTTGEMNLKSIQRLDPCAISIVDKSSHAALYQFDNNKTEWVKTSVEGPLFLYKRADFPIHSMMIANRQSLEDHIEPVTPTLRFFLEPPYVFMQTKEGEIRAVWFFEEDDCTRFYNLLVRLASRATPSPTTAASNNNELKRAIPVGIQNGCSSNDKDDARRREIRRKRREEMPALLQQLLSRETAAKLPDVPTTGAMSADQIEKQLLRRDTENESAVVSRGNVKLSATKTTTRMQAAFKAEEGNNSTLSNLLSDMSLNAPNQTPSCSRDVVPCTQRFMDKSGPEIAFEEHNSPVAPLTKEQMLAAFKHLLEDDDFIRIMHRAYVDSINTRLGLRD